MTEKVPQVYKYFLVPLYVDLHLIFDFNPLPLCH